MCVVQFKARSQVSGSDVGGGDAFPGIPPVVTAVGGHGGLFQPGLLSALRGCADWFPSRTHTTLISLCPWPRAEFCRTEKYFIRETHRCGLENYRVLWSKGCIGGG